MRFKVHDPKAHSKGGTLENTINGRADEEAAPAPQHLIHPGKDISKLYGTLHSTLYYDKDYRTSFFNCFFVILRDEISFVLSSPFRSLNVAYLISSKDDGNIKAKESSNLSMRFLFQRMDRNSYRVIKNIKFH